MRWVHARAEWLLGVQSLMWFMGRVCLAGNFMPIGCLVSSNPLPNPPPVDDRMLGEGTLHYTSTQSCEVILIGSLPHCPFVHRGRAGEGALAREAEVLQTRMTRPHADTTGAPTC